MKMSKEKGVTAIHMQEIYFCVVVLVFGFLASVNSTHAADVGIPAAPSDSSSLANAQAASLTVDQFLDEVRRSNTGYQGAATSSTGGMDRSHEGDLIISPNAFANVNLSADSKLQPTLFGNYDRSVANQYQLGIMDTTTTGTQVKLYYEADYTSITNLNYGGLIPNQSYSFYDARPYIQITQDLWGNGFGASTKAQVDYANATALSSSFNASYQSKVILTNAEAAYWQLSVSRQLVTIEMDAEERAKKIYDYEDRRAKLHLGDQADVLQAIAALETRKLEVQTARDDERVSSRAFNTSRNVNSDTVGESLQQATHPIAESLSVPNRAALRDDVKAAQQNAKAQEANSTIQSQRDLPVFQAYGQFALNGRGQDLGPTVTNSLDSGRNTVAAGVKLSIPLALGNVSSSRAGWAKELAGADLTYSKSYFDQEQSWQDLNLRFSEAKRRLTLARTIEAAQKRKLEYEKERLKKGRTTTYQVLLFEQDYILAQASRVRTEGDVFGIYTQLKLFM